jgi:tetratricopeptide (TPR) repeat protein
MSAAEKAQILGRLNRAYFNLGEYKRVVRLAQRVTEMSPPKKIGHLLLGSQYEKLKRDKEALKVYRKAVRWKNEN